MKILFFGTNNLALQVLQQLQTKHEIVGVVTVPDAKIGRKQILQPSPVAILAEEMHLRLWKPDTLKNPALVQEFEGLYADVFVVVAYGKLIPTALINIPQFKTVNVHPSLLPRYRGPSPIRTALLNGDSTTGVTIMLVDAEMDHGPILASTSIPIEPDDTNISLTEKLGALTGPLLLETLAGYVQGTITPKPQEHAKATITKLITKEDGKIRWQNSAVTIYNQFRGLYDWPGIWTTWNGQIVKILNCEIINTTCTQEPGTILFGGSIACGDKTVLQILSLQLAGKKPTDIQSFLNGYKNFVGSKFE